jgi:methylated-DNA-protein-cysteine methyltransferase-like protein
MEAFTKNVIRVIRTIPEGKVMTYGRVAMMAGNARAARQVARILSSCSDKYNLPWNRVVNAKGYISLPENRGRELQTFLLEKEGIEISPAGLVDLKRFHV